MAKELYINGILCDLNERDSPIALSFEVNDLAELQDRQAFTSRNFKIPLTQNNRIACGFPDSGAFIQLQPYRKNTAKIVQDGIEILPKGTAIITGCDSSGIEIQVLSGIIGFFETIDGKSIRDLDFSDLEHDWTIDSVVASQGNTSGYIWPVIDYGSLSATEKLVNVLQLRPAVFRKTIIERIISEAGFTAEGVVLTDERYVKSLLPFSADKFEHGKSFTGGVGDFNMSARAQVNQEFKNDTRDGVVNFTDDAATDPGNHWSGTEYTAATTMKVNVKLDYDIGVRDQYKGGSTPAIVIRIQKWNGSIWATVTENVHSTIGEFSTHIYYDQKLEADINLNTGDKVRVAWHSLPDINRVYGSFLTGSSIAVTYQAQDVIYGQSVQLEATLPDISQKDFFKDFLQNFGLTVIQDSYSKKITLFNMQEVYENKYRALDWSTKFSDSIPDTSYSFGNYGINNYGKYKADPGVPGGTGDGLMVFDNQTLKKNYDLFTSVFAASVANLRLNGLSVAEIKKIPNPEESLDFTTKTEPRIMMDAKSFVQVEFTDDEETQTVSVISLPYFQVSGLPGLGYQEYFDEHYPEILRMLYRPFAPVKMIKLSAADLQNIDFTRPIYDKKTGAYYYNNGVRDYINYQECEISLVKLQ